MTTRGTHQVVTGRTDIRRYCLGCDQRIKIGEPHGSEQWPTRLRLSREQYDLLLVAAAEFSDLSQKADDPESSVAFLDWVSVDALGTRTHTFPEAEGAPPVKELSGYSKRPGTVHREPFPLPLADLPFRRRGVS